MPLPPGSGHCGRRRAPPPPESRSPEARQAALPDVPPIENDTLDQDAGARVIDRDVTGASPRGPWAGVPDADWCDWRWQLRHRLTSPGDLARVVTLTAAEREVFAAAAARFRVGVTPYYAALMDPADPSCPIRRQTIPLPGELEPDPFALTDPLGEEPASPVPGLVHRYPDRALLYLTHLCPVYCRHCTRRRKVSDPASGLARGQLDRALAYLRAHTEIRDVLLSGGDPLTLSDARLLDTLRALRAIGHVEILRVCTRAPVTLPQRLTPALLAGLATLQPLFVHTHFNSPRECTPEAARGLRALADAGLWTANQMVLLRGVDDDAAVVRRVNHWLLRQRCRTYYLLQADLAEGTAHLRTPVQAGLDILRALRGHTSGMAVPQLVIDLPGGAGKVALLPDDLVERRQDRIVLRSWAGRLVEYPAG